MSETAVGHDLEPIPLDAVERALQGEAVAIEIEDPAKVSLAIMARILQSDNVEEILGGQKAVGGKEILGRPIEIRGVRWHRSSFAEEGGLSVFAVLDVTTLDDGEQVAVTTGAGNVMAQVFQLARVGALPIKVKLTESSTPTASGYKPQWLEAA